MLPPLRIRAGLDSSTFSAAFAESGVVQVADFLEPAAAEAVIELLAALPYALVAPDEKEQTLVITDEAVRRFGEAEVRKFLNGAVARAAKGFSFMHQSYALQDEYARDPRARDITDFLQSRAFLDFGAAILGQEVTGVRVQASKYRRGDFLTLHDDSHSKDDRLGAFTLGFTRRWRPDWGGQLLFHDARGDIEQGFLPRFNVLTVFAVPRAHSVAPVAAYAAEPRYSLTGWFIRERA
jgi:SM-20-related protein